MSVGTFSPNDFFTKYGETILHLKSAPFLPTQRVSFVPVDFVASFVVATSVSPFSLLSSLGECDNIPVFHLIGHHSDAPLTLRDVHLAAKQVCDDLEEQKYSQWIENLRNGQKCPLTPLLSYFDHGFPSLSETCDTSDEKTMEFCSKWRKASSKLCDTLSLERVPLNFQTFCLFFRNFKKIM